MCSLSMDTELNNLWGEVRFVKNHDCNAVLLLTRTGSLDGFNL